MRYAIIAITANGALLAEKLHRLLNGDGTVYGKASKYDKSLPFIPFNRMSEIMPEVFSRYDAIIFFCATGIVVRMIAPYIIKKDVDPAIIVIDEQGHHVISLLSGHLGGANALTKNIASLLGAIPVITTATDVRGIKAPDDIARELGFSVSPLENVKTINTALLSGQSVNYYIDKNLPHSTYFLTMLKEREINAAILNTNELDDCPKPLVLLTAKPINQKGVLCFLRHRLIAGIGCRRGTTQQQIEACLKKACSFINYDIDEVVLITSTAVKADEEGILLTARKYAIPVKFWDNTALQESIIRYDLHESAFVKKQIGVGNVCEAAALTGGKRKLILNKTKFEKVTVALAWEK